MLDAQTLERRDDIPLTHLNRIGDHARGLFEAEASIIMSATHPRENIKILFLSRHARLLQPATPEKPTR